MERRPPAVTGADLDAAAVLARLVRHGDRQRVALLIAHGVYKIGAGVLMLAAGPLGFTGQTFRYLARVPGFPGVLALMAILGGASILAGVVLHRRGLQASGLCVVAAFDLTLAVGIGAGFGGWVAYPGGSARPSLYPIAIYLHLFSIMVLHVVTLRQWRVIERTVAGRGLGVA